MVPLILRVVAVVSMASIVAGCSQTTEPVRGVWGKMQMLHVTDQFAGRDSIYSRATAQFYQDADTRSPIDAGIVLFNGHSIPFLIGNQTYDTDTVPSRSDYEEWVIGGKGDIPSVKLQIAPVTPLRITSLKANDTLHYMRDTLITWSPAVGGNAGINIDDTSGTVYSMSVPDNGSNTILSSEWHNPHKGPAFVYVFRGSNATGQSGNKIFQAASEADARVRVILVP